MKRVLSLLFAIVFVVAAFPVTFASAADVIEISDAAQLAQIGNNDNYPLNGSYKLTKNISLNGYESWTPIGLSSAFSGTFEGNGKTISGLTVNTSGSYAGLFGQVSGTVKNLTVTGSVTLNALSTGAANAYAGIIAGYTSGWATIYSCSTSGSVTVTASTSGSGGWFGSGSATAYAGGVVGNHASMNVIEMSAHESGTVTANANASTSANTTAYAGGVVGKATASIVDCYNTGEVSANASSSGGTANAYSGGVLGGGTANILGSIFGSSTKIATSYNSGDVSASGSSKSVAGAIAGDMGSVKAENCYYTDGCCANAFGSYSGDTAPSATKLSSSAARKESSYIGFDFESVWTMKLLGTPTHISCGNIITGEVMISGYFEAGQTLKADMSKVEPSSAYDGAIKRVKYQWYEGVKNENDIVYNAISGATRDEYTITTEQIGKYIRLEVKGKRGIVSSTSYGGVLVSEAGKVTAAVPKNVKAENTDDGVKVTWDKVSGASQYTIYRSEYSSGILGFGAGFGSFTSVGTATTNSYLDTSVTNNSRYKYKVSVTINGSESDQSTESSEITASLPCQHTWDSGKETTKATCTEAGVKTYTCSLCGSTRTEVIPAKGHSYTNERVTKEPTCTEDGKKSSYCTSCWTQVEEAIPALGHSYNSGVVTTPATCENDGVKTYTCANCNGTKTEVIKATGHSYGAGVVTTPATCESDGVRTYTCANCNGVKTEAIKATGHSFTNATVIKEPTCTETGLKAGTCTACKKTTQEAIPALGHDFSGDFVIDRAPTSYAEGEKSKRCTRCGVRGQITSIAKIEQIKAPDILTMESTNEGVEFTWSAVYGVEGYIIFKLIDGAYKDIAVVGPQTRKYIDKTAVNGETYCYAVAARDDWGNVSAYSEFAFTYKKLTSLAVPTVKLSNTASGIKVTWNSIENAESYTVYKRVYNESTKKYSKWSVMKLGYTATSILDKEVKPGTIYSYTVRAVNGDVRSNYKVPTGLRYNLAPTIKVTNVGNGVKVSWSTVANAEGYMVYSSTYNTKTKKWSSWKKRGNAASTTTSWVDKNVKSGTYYKYTVRAFVYGYKGAYNKSGVKTLFLSQPTVKYANTQTGIKVSWSKIAGAKSYTLYRAAYIDGKWSSWKNVGSCKNNAFSCVDKGVESGVTYRYTVRAVNGDYRSSYKTPSGLMFLTQPSVSVAKASNGIKVSWDKAEGATGYTVYRAEYNTKTKKWSSWKNLGTAKSYASSYTDKSASSGKTYRYTVRAVNGNSRSSYKTSSSIKR